MFDIAKYQVPQKSTKIAKFPFTAIPFKETNLCILQFLSVALNQSINLQKWMNSTRSDNPIRLVFFIMYEKYQYLPFLLLSFNKSKDYIQFGSENINHKIFHKHTYTPTNHRMSNIPNSSNFDVFFYMALFIQHTTKYQQNTIIHLRHIHKNNLFFV